jgi:hypothetical protein
MREKSGLIKSNDSEYCILFFYCDNIVVYLVVV